MFLFAKPPLIFTFIVCSECNLECTPLGERWFFEMKLPPTPPTHLETIGRCVEFSPTSKTSQCCVELRGVINWFSFATCRKRFSWEAKNMLPNLVLFFYLLQPKCAQTLELSCHSKSSLFHRHVCTGSQPFHVSQC